MGTAPDLVLVGYALAERRKVVFVQLPETTLLEFYFQYKRYGKNMQITRRTSETGASTLSPAGAHLPSGPG
ncbi:hypothetical protein [Pseudomonas oryzihabitans]|uniref:hypothetical protein n=1 Tax=Pseudomonas oryzihabitans TaxID=47885 RepID=UPI0011A8D817|nr:hypothetical protein [Pseudomonas psychrotolerans]